MKESADLVSGWRALAPGSPALLATVVATSGSTYRRPGARMLIAEGGWAAGSISGGCLEGDVLRTAWERTAEGPALVTYDATADDDIVWGFGLGCNGVVQVLMERLPAEGGPLAFLADRRDRREPGVLATVVSEGPWLGRRLCVPECPSLSGGEGLPEAVREDARSLLGRSGHTVRSYDEITVLFESILPPMPLLVFGAGHDAAPVVAAAKALGWHVTVVDGRARSDRFPEADAVLAAAPADVASSVSIDGRTAAVVMTHNYLHDLALLRTLLPSAARYVGLLGPARRAERLLNELRDDGFVPTPEQKARLHAPIGLDLGAEGPDEIALAVVAEIQAAANGRGGGFLNGKREPLHAPGSGLADTTTKEAPACDLLAS